LIPLYADETEFEFRQVPENEQNYAELKRIWPFGRFPLLLDNGEPVIESTPIIEHLQAHHPGPNAWIPEGELGREIRFLDRFFDLYVMDNMQAIVGDVLRPEESRDAYGVAKARERLNVAYDWIEQRIGEKWAAGARFTLADCAAAPSLFYADWVEEIGPERPKLSAYRARLLQHPYVARVVDEARPYRPYFPLGAPDRD
jgi:glutathione S-transferase